MKIEVFFVLSEDQITDILTKALIYTQFDYLHSKLDVHSIHLNLREGVRECKNKEHNDIV